MRKRLITAAVAVCDAVIMTMPVLAASTDWRQNNRGWWYRYMNGGYAKAVWVSNNENWYRMDENGYMQTSWANVDGNWYYLGASGSMQTGAIVDNGYHCLLSTQYNGRYGHMVQNDESFEGRIIRTWTAGSDHPKGALQGDNNIGTGKGYSGAGNIDATQSGKRGQNVPPASIDPAQDERYTRNPERPPMDSGSKFNWDVVRNNMQGSGWLNDYSPLLSKSVIR